MDFRGKVVSLQRESVKTSDMSTTINIPVEVPYGYDFSQLLTKVADYVRLFVPVTGQPTVAEVEQAEPVITEADLVIDPAVEAMFSSVPPLSPDIDIRQEYGKYLYEKYK